MTELPGSLFRQWVHSHEEDEEGVRVYRPIGYPFPRSRGRRGIEFRENGEFVELSIAQTDRLEALRGRWISLGLNRLELSYAGEQRPPKTIEIISCDYQVLRVGMPSL